MTYVFSRPCCHDDGRGSGLLRPLQMAREARRCVLLQGLLQGAENKLVYIGKEFRLPTMALRFKLIKLLSINHEICLILINLLCKMLHLDINETTNSIKMIFLALIESIQNNPINQVY